MIEPQYVKYPSQFLLNICKVVIDGHLSDDFCFVYNYFKYQYLYCQKRSKLYILLRTKENVQFERPLKYHFV